MIIKALFQKERGIVACVNKRDRDLKIDMNALSLRLRLNHDLKYYILEYDDSIGIPFEAFVQTLKQHPNLLDESNMIREVK